MNETKKLARRLDAARKELDECAEAIDRIARDIETVTPKPSAKLDLVGQAEIAAMTGINRSTVAVNISRGQLPAPVAELACGRVWLRSDIARWARGRQ